MGQAETKKYITPEEYFAFCEQNEGRYEWYNGEIFAMAGAMPDHNGVATAFTSEIYTRIKGRGCRIYQSDQRLYIAEAGIYTLPDISVYCDSPQYSPGRRDSLTNPLLLIEVLSTATEHYDRGTKFGFYKLIPSLKEYVMVSYTSRMAEVYTRQDDDSWLAVTYTAHRPHIELHSLGITLPIDDLYAMIIMPVYDRKPGQ